MFSLFFFCHFQEISILFSFYCFVTKYTVFCCRECCSIFSDRKTLTQHQISNHRKDKNVPNTNINIKHNKYNKYNNKPSPSSSHSHSISNNIYFCDFKGCNKIFEKKSILNKHKKVHIKSYRCSFTSIGCTQCFSTKKDKKVHERIHRNQKCEVCRFCCKAFTDPAALRKHIKYIHEDGIGCTPFVCKECRKQFKRKDSLQKHWQTHSKRRRTIKHCFLFHVKYDIYFLRITA